MGCSTGSRALLQVLYTTGIQLSSKTEQLLGSTLCARPGQTRVVFTILLGFKTFPFLVLVQSQSNEFLIPQTSIVAIAGVLKYGEN